MDPLLRDLVAKLAGNYLLNVLRGDHLHSYPRCEKRSFEGVDPGLHVVTLDHEGNTTSSIEKGEAIVEKIKELLGKEWIDTDTNGDPLPARNLDQEDILIVTAYNAQVKYLKSLMNKNGWNRIAVGTFDKFQSREAPVVLVSMVTSTAEVLPRGIEFSLSSNRLKLCRFARWMGLFLLPIFFPLDNGIAELRGNGDVGRVSNYVQLATGMASIENQSIL